MGVVGDGGIAGAFHRSLLLLSSVIGVGGIAGVDVLTTTRWRC